MKLKDLLDTLSGKVAVSLSINGEEIKYASLENFYKGNMFEKRIGFADDVAPYSDSPVDKIE